MRGPLEPFLHQLVGGCARNEIRRCGDDRDLRTKSTFVRISGAASANRIRTTCASPPNHPTIGSKPDDPGVPVERDLAKRALDTAHTRGATYADVRFVRRDEENAL